MASQLGSLVASGAPILATMPTAAPASSLPPPPPPPQPPLPPPHASSLPSQSAAAASAAIVNSAHEQIDASANQVRTATVTTAQLLQILVKRVFLTFRVVFFGFFLKTLDYLYLFFPAKKSKTRTCGGRAPWQPRKPSRRSCEKLLFSFFGVLGEKEKRERREERERRI